MENYIELGGKSRPVSFGMAFGMIYEQDTGRDFFDAMEIFQAGVKSMTMMIELFRAGLKAGAQLKGESFDYDMLTVAGWIDESPTALKKLLKMLLDSQRLIEDEEAKKPAASKAKKYR